MTTVSLQAPTQQENRAMRFSYAATVVAIGVSGAFSACTPGMPVDANDNETATTAATTYQAVPDTRSKDWNERVSMSPHDLPHEGSGMRPEFWRCAEIGAWPDAAECIGHERTYQDARLNSAFQQLMERLEVENQTRATIAQRAWLRAQEADGMFEASLFDSLGSIGNFEAGSNEVLRICSRARQIDGYAGSENPDPATMKTPEICTEPSSSCADDEPGNLESKLDDAYEKLMSLVDDDLRKKLAESQRAWIDLQEADAELERSISPNSSSSGKKKRNCARAEQLEKYALVIE
ncbi:DUF1311 domain-containing protein [Luteimonas marina]|uniref:DUF1311 domain-containing protein n=1 Tax=Luteimonas marina TaxID=488485 RepID=A0A5C5U2R0_9GAMM|nr:lysozyme inhibitor LprI family protein [Luteimonas marina]TWT20224.1 DUF1311 domain-containing protein [Luteimonas marina]